MSLTETKSAQAAPSTTNSSRESRKTSLIASDLEVIGDLKGKGEIQIEGKVKGEVRSTSATISPGAEIDGTVVADAVEVAGQVKGRIEARQVRILKSAKMLGDVVHEMLEIEAGAEIEGAFQRLSSGGKR